MILYPDEFPVDDFMREYRTNELDEDGISRIHRLYPLLEEKNLAASIWETKIELYDDPLNVLKFPDEIKRLIISFTKPKSETAHDLICTWCSPKYLDIYRLKNDDVVGFRANASELHVDSKYRSWPRHMLPLKELSDVERDIYHCSEHLGYTVNQCLPDCVMLWDLPEDIIQMPVFHGLKVDGNHVLFGIRCALMFIDETKLAEQRPVGPSINHVTPESRSTLPHPWQGINREDSKVSSTRKNVKTSKSPEQDEKRKKSKSPAVFGDKWSSRRWTGVDECCFWCERWLERSITIYILPWSGSTSWWHTVRYGRLGKWWNWCMTSAFQ